MKKKNQDTVLVLPWVTECIVVLFTEVKWEKKWFEGELGKLRLMITPFVFEICYKLPDRNITYATGDMNVSKSKKSNLNILICKSSA